MTTPTGIRRELDQIDRLATAADTWATQQLEDARDRADDDAEESWYWTAVTAHKILGHLDRLEEHLAKLGVVGLREVP